MAPALIAAIAMGVKNLLGAVGAKKRADATENLEQTKYNDQVKTYYDEQAQEEQRRQEKLRLVATFAKANGLDSALTPEMLEMLSKPRSPVAPPPYRKGGTPGFGWDLAGMAAETAGSIYSAAKAPKRAGLQGIDPKKLLGGTPTPSGFGSSVNFGFPSLIPPGGFGSNVTFRP